MSEHIGIEYCKGFKCDWRILAPTGCRIEIMIMPRQIPINKENLGKYFKENIIYFLMEDSIIRNPMKYFLLDKEKLNEDEINLEYQQNYKKYRPKVYVGKTGDVKTRFNPHNKDFWEYVVFIRSTLENGFTDEECSFIERFFYNKYKDGVFVDLDNSITPPGKELLNNEYIKVRKYLNEIEEILYTIDKFAFDIDRIKYTANNKKHKINADAYIIDNKITIVVAGTEASKNYTKNANETLKKRREKLINTKVIELKGRKYVFMKDYIFLSTSGAAETILGYNKNGKKLWREKKNN